MRSSYSSGVGPHDGGSDVGGGGVLVRATGSRWKRIGWGLRLVVVWRSWEERGSSWGDNPSLPRGDWGLRGAQCLGSCQAKSYFMNDCG